MYRGLNTLACYNNLWKEVGCIEAGAKYPEKLTLPELNRLAALDLQ